MIHYSGSEPKEFPNQFGRYYNHLDSYVLCKDINPLRISSNMSWTTTPQNIDLHPDSPIWGSAMLMSYFYRRRNITTNSGALHHFSKQFLHSLIQQMRQKSKQNWQSQSEKLSKNVNLNSVLCDYYSFPIKLLLDTLGFRAVDDNSALTNDLQQAINKIMSVSQWSFPVANVGSIADRRLQSLQGMNQLINLIQKSTCQSFSKSPDSVVINQWIESELILLIIASVHTTQLQMMSLLHLFLFNPKANSLSISQMIQYSSPLVFSVRFLKIHDSFSIHTNSSIIPYQTKPWLIPLLSSHIVKSGVNHFGFGEHKCCGSDIANTILYDSIQFIRTLLTLDIDFSSYQVSSRWSRHPSPLFRGWRLHFDG